MKKNKIKSFLLRIIGIVLLIWFAYYLYAEYKKIDITPEYEINSTDSTINVQTVDSVLENSESISDMLEKVSQSVVGISRIKSHSNSIFSNNSVNELGLGTGVIISSNGYILSNCHVTGEKYGTCYITLENGYTYEGSVVWCDNDLDLSITKIDATNLPYATIGNSSNIKSGETVYAIGNPIGYEFRRTITSGIISATNRTISIEENNDVTYMTDLIQTDASINPGNSGGPLIFPSGEIIGINTVKITSAEGIGFAVPINVIKPVIEKYITQNNFDEAFLGIYAYDKEVIPYISSTTNFTSGIYVVHIDESSPAISCGIQIGDIITSIDDTSVNNMIELKEYIYSKLPGDTISINISRGYVTRTFDVVLSSK
jgi:S1-C subfamily serine protease